MTAVNTRLLNIGSMICSVRSDPLHYADTLARVYGTSVRNFNSMVTTKVDLNIDISEEIQVPERYADTLVVKTTERGYSLVSDPLHCRLTTDTRIPTVEFIVKDISMNSEKLDFHFWLLTNRMLLLLNRLLLHTAAIEFEGSVNLFCGRKRAGKTTLSVAFGLAGAEVLAEDHVILHKNTHSYFVSGCTSRFRVTSETEQILFANRLDSKAFDVGGYPKKEFEAEQFFATNPYQEKLPKRLFLTRVGDAVSIKPATSREALLWMMNTTGELLRFSTKDDYRSFMQFLAEFVNSVKTYSLELSPDVAEATRVPELLQKLAKCEGQ